MVLQNRRLDKPLGLPGFFTRRAGQVAPSGHVSGNRPEPSPSVAGCLGDPSALCVNVAQAGRKAKGRPHLPNRDTARTPGAGL